MENRYDHTWKNSVSDAELNPKNSSWNSFSKKLEENKKKKLNSKLRILYAIAASVILLVSIFSAVLISKQKNNIPLAVAQKEDPFFIIKEGVWSCPESLQKVMYVIKSKNGSVKILMEMGEHTLEVEGRVYRNDTLLLIRGLPEENEAYFVKNTNGKNPIFVRYNQSKNCDESLPFPHSIQLNSENENLSFILREDTPCLNEKWKSFGNISGRELAINWEFAQGVAGNF
jgi:hypothetical protein